jgi:hypothetical protein
MSTLGKNAPRLMDYISENVMVPREFRDEPPRDPRGTLNRPSRSGEVYGDEPGFVRPVSVYTEAVMHPVIASIVAGAALGIAALVAASLVQDELPRRSTPRFKLRRSNIKADLLT